MADRSLIHFSRTYLIVWYLLFQAAPIEPQLVVSWIQWNQLLQILSSLLQDDIFNFITGPVLFLKKHMLLIDRLRSFFRQVLKRIFTQDFRSLQLMLPDFKLCKRNKETLTECSFAKLYQCPFIVSPSSAMVTLVFFKIGCFDKTRGCRVHIDEFFKYDSTLIKVTLSLLKL